MELTLRHNSRSMPKLQQDRAVVVVVVIGLLNHCLLPSLTQLHVKLYLQLHNLNSLSLSLPPPEEISVHIIIKILLYMYIYSHQGTSSISSFTTSSTFPIYFALVGRHSPTQSPPFVLLSTSIFHCSLVHSFNSCMVHTAIHGNTEQGTSVAGDIHHRGMGAASGDTPASSTADSAAPPSPVRCADTRPIPIRGWQRSMRRPLQPRPRCTTSRMKFGYCHAIANTRGGSVSPHPWNYC